MANQQTSPDQIIQIGEWTPDLPAFGNPGSTVIINALPVSQFSYGPVTSLQNVGITGIPSSETIIGVYQFVDNLVASHIFAATESRIFHLSLGTGTNFVDATNLGGNYHADVDAPWQFTAFFNSVIAVNAGDQPQIMAIGDLEFSPITSAPTARCCATVRDFLMLGNVVELSDQTAYPSRLHWSALGDPNNFPVVGSNAAQEVQSDIQDLRTDLGEIKGIVSNLQTADMAIIMDDGVYVGYYVSSPAIFNFQIAQGAVGCRSPQSIITNHGVTRYLGLDGFYEFDGTTPRPIGAQKIDNFFFGDLDIGFLDRVQGAADPTGKYIYWLYHGPNSNGVANRLLIYNWSLQRWGFATIQAQWIAKSISLGYSLDELDQFCPPGEGLDGLPFTLDSPAWKGGAPGLYAFDKDAIFSRFGGPNLAATIETTEIQPTPARRSKVTNSRPLVDGGTPTVTLGYRNQTEDIVAYGPAVPTNIYGDCPQLVDSRLFRARLSIPAGSVWHHAEGIEINFCSTTPR